MIYLQHKDSFTQDSLQYVMRNSPAKRLKRLRIAWFVLGALSGGVIAYCASTYLHAQEYSKRHSKPVVYAERQGPVQPMSAIVTVKAPVAASTASSAHTTALTLPASLNVPVQRGDTLMSMLMDRGIARDEAYAIVQSMKKVYNPRSLSIGQSLEMRLEKSRDNSGRPSLAGLSIPVSPLRTINVSRTAHGADAFTIKEVKAPVFKSLARAGGTINSSLYQTGIDSGMPPQMLNEIINAMSYDVDFARDIHEGDELDVVYERMHTDKNVTTGYGNVVYASLVLGGRELTIYRHISPDGFSGYYNAKGESVKKALLRTPINGAHVTSGFGMRMHPLLGYSKMHKGVDFGAATGTPIYAAGDGTVEEAGRKGGYGNYVRIKHNNNYATAYGHASRIARGIRPGAHVKQGQVIAYVGSTGQSTGPHLHYEILMGGAQVNPSGVKFRTGQTLAGRELAQFRQQVKQVETALATTPRNTQLAQAR